MEGAGEGVAPSGDLCKTRCHHTRLDSYGCQMVGEGWLVTCVKAACNLLTTSQKYFDFQNKY